MEQSWISRRAREEGVCRVARKWKDLHRSRDHPSRDCSRA